jgi:hypothetical protein
MAALIACLLAALLAPPAAAVAEEETLEAIQKGIFDSFSVPLEEGPVEGPWWKQAAAGLSGNVGFTYPLSQTVFPEAGQGSQGTRTATSPNFNQTIRYNPAGAWFGLVTFYQYIEPDKQAPWNPDWTYVFGYDDWRPYTLSLVYANYSGNRLAPDRSLGEKITRFEEGVISLGWKLPFPEELKEYFLIDPDGAIGHGVYYNAMPRYERENGPGRGEWKQSLSFATRFTVWKWLFAEFTLFWYPIGGQQQPWDPDFTYGFGWFDWHPWTLSLQYNNYSGNRWPGRSLGRGNGRFDDGAVSLWFSWAL